MPRRITISRIVGTLLPNLLVATFVFGQQPERENLTEPTYRVSKSTDVGALKPMPDPTATVSSVEALSGRRPVLDASSIDGDAASRSTPPSALEDVTAKAPKTESEQIFEQAMIDAAATLAHIKKEVHDYTCMFIKRENVNGKIVGPQYIYTKVRNRKMDGGKLVVPFSVYMKFVKPTNLKGREVLYVENTNNGRLWAKEGGIKGRVIPAMTLDTNSRFVMSDNRYPITEFGIETLTQRLLERGHADRNIADCEIVYKSGATVCGRPCRFLEVRRAVPKKGEDAKYGMNVPLARVFTDEELSVPIRYVAYDWPTHNGPPQVLEEYTYQNLQLNVGLTDADFDKKNAAYGFR